MAVLKFNNGYLEGFTLKFDISPHDSKKLYAGSNYLHLSEDGGQSWNTISPDLTRNIPETILSLYS